MGSKGAQREWALGGIWRGLGVKGSRLRDLIQETTQWAVQNGREGGGVCTGGIMDQRERGKGVDPDHVTGEWGGEAWIPRPREREKQWRGREESGEWGPGAKNCGQWLIKREQRRVRKVRGGGYKDEEA